MSLNSGRDKKNVSGGRRCWAGKLARRLGNLADWIAGWRSRTGHATGILARETPWVSRCHSRSPEMRATMYYVVRALPALVGMGKRDLGRRTGGGLCLGAWVPRAVPRDCENPRDFKMPSSASLSPTSATCFLIQSVNGLD